MTEIEVGEVAMVPRESIEVGERAREEMGDLVEFESSIKKQGLIQPLAVLRLGPENYLLLAGERRFRILTKNEVPLVPARIFTQALDEEEIRAIELAENYYRKDFEYWERDNLIRETHEIHQKIHGSSVSGPGEQGWTLEDTANMMGMKSKGSVSTAIQRADARDAFPELFDKAKTQSDASKVLKKVDEAIVKEVIANKIKSERADSSIVKIASNYILGDFFAGAPNLPDNAFHMVEIDPPYAIGLKEAKKRQDNSESIYDLNDYNEVHPSVFMDGDSNPATPWRGMKEVFKQSYRVMADHSWLICWFGPEPWFEDIYQAIVGAGFGCTRMCGIWIKSGGQSKRPEIHLANSYEMFFYAWKGRPALNKAGRSNGFPYPPVPPQQKTHPTERPLELMRDVYDTFAFQGSRVLIPFLGSGVGILAANDLGMSAMGYELGKSHKDSFLVRLHGMKTV